ncbi:MAG: hypothetical protein ACKVN9_09905 [Methylophilaceae bacterium]
MNHSLFALLILAVCGLQPCFADDGWRPIKDVSLLIEPGSILDFSQLVPQEKLDSSRLLVANNGYFATQSEPNRPRRFLMASLGFAGATGGLPDHALADLYARQLRLHGYNMARLDFVEETLMLQRKIDFDFNPDQLDRFYYLLAALKKEGIYYVLNGLSSDNAAYGNIKERWVDQRHAKLRVYFDPEMQAHWKKLMERMLASVNPYTKTSTLADPALAGIIMVNEGGLAFVTRGGVPNELRPLFSEWLKKKYGNNVALAKAWKGELTHGESLEAKSVGFPKPDAWTGSRMSDTQQFFADLEKSTADWMTLHFRQLGYKGLVTAYDNWLSPAMHVTRGQLDWVDMHNYFFEPTSFTTPGSVMRQESLFEDNAKYIRELAAGKHIGKPFTTSEYGQVFWNKYRRESALAFPAYASFQDWTMICQHAGAIDLSYAATGGRKDAIYPFVLGLDPIARANETLAALLFLRGDVAPAKHMIGVKLTPKFVYQDSAFLGNMPTDISRLSLVTGIGLDWQGRLEASGQYEAQVEPGNANLNVPGKANANQVENEQSLAARLDELAHKYAGKLGPKISKTALIVEDRWASRVAAIRQKGILAATNQTNAMSKVYQTDTNQILMDSEKKRLTVITPKTEAVVFDMPEPITLANLQIESADSPALVSVSAMDDQPLESSKRMLLILATDARNSDMRFADAAETTLQSLGRKPILMKTAVVKLHLKNTNKTQLKVYSTTLRGKRGDVIPVIQEADGISFVLDTKQLSHGPSTYFEISGQE